MVARPDAIRREFGTPTGAVFSGKSPDDIRTELGVPGGKPWTFTQLGGQKKILTLRGWGAPFGRPRQDPVAKTPIRIRQYERRYPGNDVPTRHLFGVQWDDVELHGRWMDRDGGRGFAKAKTEEVIAFINDQQRVRVTWDSTLSFVGLLDSLEPAWESPAEVEWKLNILVDTNDALKPTLGPVPQAKSPGGILNQIVEAMGDSTATSLTTPPVIKPSFFDFLDTLVGIINAPAAALLSIGNEVDSFRHATFSELARLRGVLQQYRQAIQKFRTVYEVASVQTAIEFDRADEELRLYRQQAAFGATMAAALGKIVEADRAAARAQRSRIKKFVTARQGDTWESISVEAYNSADRAADIREANVIPSGQMPVPGATYAILN